MNQTHFASEVKSIFRKLFIIIFLPLLTGCLGPMHGLFPVEVGRPTETIFVVNHGWHTGIVVKSDRLPDKAKPPWEAVAKSRYLEIGWGDDGFYRADRITSGIAMRAFIGNLSVLHIVAMDEEPETYFPNSGLIRISVSADGFGRLSDFLASSFELDANGQMTYLGKGIYGTSRFYRAVGKYYFPNTCNKWTARALRQTGVPITPFYAVRARNVFEQAKTFGTLVRELSEE